MAMANAANVGAASGRGGVEKAAGSAAVLRAAEAALAVRKPVPQWAVEGVLLSRDLAPHLLAPLESEDGEAAAVCSAWADGWKATEDSRRRLRAVPFDLPQELREKAGWLNMLVVPGDEERLVVAKDEQSVFHTAGGTLSRISLDGVELASFDTSDHNIFVEDADDDRVPKKLAFPVLAPGGLLFVNAFVEGSAEGAEQDEILALDAESLQLRFRFGLGLLNNSYAMAMGGDELYICDKGNDRVQVFSLAGEHRRSLVGEWKSPQWLRFVKNRLYLVEGEPEKDEEDEEEEEDSRRRRVIWVLSLQGDTLYTFTVPVAGHCIYSLQVFDGKLLAQHRHLQSCTVTGVLALRGL